MPGAKQMRIQVNMPHGHPSGWAPNEIGPFIASHCIGGSPLPVPGQPIIEGEKVRLTFTAATALKSTTLHCTTDDVLRSKRTGIEMPAEIADGVITAPRPLAEANTWFISVTDDRDVLVTTDVQFAKP